jgi:hypothetical protein
VNDADKTRLTVATYRKITKDEVSTDEEVNIIINNIYKLSNLVYGLIKTN